MSDEDIRQIRELLEDIRTRVKDSSDKGIIGQWNTFQYVANSQDAKAWAAGTQVGTEILNHMRQRSDYLRDYIDSTIKATDIFETFINEQSKINNGNY